ncbi:CBS domain-containing protein [Fictibacillus iocasae]|uniref:CBS domain-containing protein n=1 Tax=Fictibacillus iocasae TaxID=2715437 RepID=A0ABW2NQJ8_9BACL
MNVAFFLLPKKEVAFLKSGVTIRQAIEKMANCRFSAIPIIDQQGKYSFTITEGDILWFLKNNRNVTFDNCHHFSIDHIQPFRKMNTVHIDAEMEDLLQMASEQNFVPVVDDSDIFIGIVRRKEIIEYCRKMAPAYRSS